MMFFFFPAAHHSSETGRLKELGQLTTKRQLKWWVQKCDLSFHFSGAWRKPLPDNILCFTRGVVSILMLRISFEDVLRIVAVKPNGFGGL